jgi:RNA polymerase sigma factor (sigma-70 family)
MAEQDITPTDEQQRLLLRAKEAASAKDLKAMVEALYASGVLDGLVRRLGEKWSSALDAEDVDFAIAQATDVLYLAVTQGTRFTDLVAFLWKVADRRLCDRVRQRRRERPRDPADMERVVAADDSTEDDGADRERKRAQALAVARSVLPRLGQEHVQSVMAYVFDAVEAGREDVPNAEIAEALGLSNQTVRTSLSRGFKRLSRIALENGLAESGLDAESLSQVVDQGAEDDTDHD